VQGLLEVLKLFLGTEILVLRDHLLLKQNFLYLLNAVCVKYSSFKQRFKKLFSVLFRVNTISIVIVIFIA